ncbi:MAG: SMC-Scp complex subunit ScpB, partial [Candidatus Berkiella sp.]
MKKSIDELVIIVEGLLFAANEPLTAEALAKLFIDEVKPKAQDIKKALTQIKNHYQNRGIELHEVASGFRFQVTQTVVPYIAKTIEEKPARYSRALLETLALIAYRQPITRGEIEEIRGVVVSSNIVKTLDEQGWIRVVGHKEVPGKPALYATTKSFLDHFGLKSLEDLPPLAQLQDFDSLVQNVQEDLSPSDKQLPLDIEQDANDDVDETASTQQLEAAQIDQDESSTDSMQDESDEEGVLAEDLDQEYLGDEGEYEDEDEDEDEDEEYLEDETDNDMLEEESKEEAFDDILDELFGEKDKTD